MLRLLSRGRKPVSAQAIMLFIGTRGSLQGRTLQTSQNCLVAACSTANPLPRLLAAPLQAEGGEDEPKQYKKANLGLANQMYYNEEVGRAKAATRGAAVAEG